MLLNKLNRNARKTIFAALVALQDLGQLSISDTRKRIKREHNLSELQLNAIEEEGIEKQWPPL